MPSTSAAPLHRLSRHPLLATLTVLVLSEAGLGRRREIAAARSAMGPRACSSYSEHLVACVVVVGLRVTARSAVPSRLLPFLPSSAYGGILGSAVGRGSGLTNKVVDG
jgi:hypothetical protein